MLKQLMRMARTPPSPKNRAWITSATLTAMTAAQGPRMIAARAPPTPCAVVPPGTGTLNIMIVKLSAEKIARRGIVRLFRTVLTRWVATAQIGRVSTPAPIEITGLR